MTLVHKLQPVDLSDEGKTREQLLSELREMRARITSFEKTESERRKAEDALRESEANLKLAQEVAHVGIAIWDLQTGLVRWSDEMYRIFGVDKTVEITYELYLSLIHPDDRSYVVNAINDGIATKRTSSMHYRIIWPDGQVRFLHGEGRVVYDGDNSTYIIGTSLDITDRKRAENSLEESMARSEQRSGELEATLSSIAAGVMIYDRSGKVVRINGLALDMIGLSSGELDMDNYDLRREVIGHSKPDGTLMKREDAPYYRALHGEFITGEEVLFMLKGREPICVSTAASPIRNSKGEITGAIAIFTDITERKRAEEALRESEERYRAFFDNSLDAYLITAPDGSIEAVNDEACRIFGMSKEEIIRAGRGGVIDLSDQRHRLAAEERTRTGQFKGELNCRRKDGTIFPTELYTKLFRDMDGRVKTAMIIRDITERKLAEEALDKYRLFSENTRDIVLFVSRDGRIIEANDAAIKAYGYSREEILSKSIYDLRVTDPGHRVDVQMDTAFEKGILFETLHLRKDGSIIPVEVSSQGLIINGKKVLLSVIRDITERKRAEEELKEAKMHAELYLDLMGHDISNMHQIAMGQLELAQDVIKTDGKLEADYIEMIDISLSSLWRSAKLIDNVRKLQKIRSDEVKHKKISLDEVLKGVVDQYNGKFPEKSIRVDGEGSHIVEADELLQDVFTNLVGNAIKHSNGSKVDILVKLEDVGDNGKKYYKISIEDNGPGISDDQKDKIFNRLQRGETKARGMGLGLYLVKSLVDSYSGKVWAEDRIPGDYMKGSRFVVMLPAAGK